MIKPGGALILSPAFFFGSVEPRGDSDQKCGFLASQPVTNFQSALNRRKLLAEVLRAVHVPFALGAAPLRLRRTIVFYQDGQRIIRAGQRQPHMGRAAVRASVPQPLHSSMKCSMGHRRVQFPNGPARSAP